MLSHRYRYVTRWREITSLFRGNFIVSGRLHDDVFGSGWRPTIAQVAFLVSRMAHSNGCGMSDLGSLISESCG